LTAFVVVLGTLLIQGLTLRPLLIFLRLPKDAVVEDEVRTARQATLEAMLAELESDDTPPAQRLRLEYGDALSRARKGLDPRDTPDNALRRRLVAVSRRAIEELRTANAIGDDSYQLVEEELDWLELNARSADVRVRDDQAKK
jgi:monovalent cation/hydrogen antiporter